MAVPQTMKTVTASRGLVLALLVLALWNPPLLTRQGTLDIALVDLTSTESAEHDALVARLNNTLASLNLEANWHPVTASTTNADTAISAARQSIPTASANPLLLLVADDTAEYRITEYLQKSPTTRVSNFWLPVPTSTTEEPASIVAVNAPSRANELTQIPVTVHLTANLTGHYLVRARIATNSVDQNVSLDAGQQQTLTLWLQGSAGNHQLVVSVHNPEQKRPPLTQYHHGITVEGAGTLLLISDRHQQLPGLPAEARKQLTVTSALLMSHLEWLAEATTIVLDNIAIEDLPPQAWALLEQQVRQRGTSMWVLGGDHSFSAGGYRGSVLEEQLLPVISEAALQKPAAAVVFLIDHSGSMGGSDGHNMALSMANRAVEASVAALAAEDQVGLVEFADRARLVAAPGRYSRQQLLQLLTLDASGSTQLSAGLEQAIAQLRQSELEQRLLVLVTDGFTADIDIAAWRLQLREAGVTLVALAVGVAPDLETLEQLAWSEDSQVLRVSKVSDLPQLMANTVAQQRNPARGATQVIQRRSLDNTTSAYQWPEVSQLQTTRAKQQARQYLVAASGEPLLADIRVGAGRVLALPAGLYEWVPAWQSWPQLSRVMKQLMQLDGAFNDSSALTLEAQQVGRELRIVVEMAPVNGAAMTTLTVYGPNAQRLDLAMPASAPGLYMQTVKNIQPGNHLLQVNQGDLEIEQAYYHQPVGELSAAREAGLLTLWTTSALAELAINEQQHKPRWFALLAAVLAYLTSVWLESGRPGILRRSPPH
ncbi:vWA domain-containing protein [Candidatus Litorirhabdus singularis]|nr:VWA domain-containing protein [Candidatus Litorirhabdus singularis]